MSSPKVYQAAEVLKHNKKDDLWMIINNKVYDVTKFVDEHPGGEEVLLDVAGTDATDAFEDIGHSDDARDMLKEMYIGTVDGVAPQGTTSTDKKSSTSDSGSGSQIPLFAVTALLLALIAWYSQSL
ncbi:DEKNAAC104350 [Brettanomyces naardenensis]|uniref:DEKNAAC104350 n=1 Tax=Brettanomyces naardenensis TaxID=13370 RepID=A0A448YQU0_BRENA|nr:DEKNAAC104350 [Brettanomyces naardenensis]